MQANAKKARRLEEMDDRDDDPSDTFNSIVSEDIISDDDLDDFIRNFSDMTELKLNLDSLCIAGYPTNCPKSDRNDCEDLYHSLRYSYNHHIDDCDEIMFLGLADMSHMSIFNDFDETDDKYHG